jgi:cell division protein FtsI/penicillin-binding protein 2
MINPGSNNLPVSSSRRIGFFFLLFALLMFVVLVKLFEIQVVESAKYKLAAKKQYESRISLRPERGLIFDRKLNALVTNASSYSFAADPNMIDNKDSVASIFAVVFEKEKSYYLEKLNTENTSFIWLERRAEEKYSSRLKDMNVSGVIKLNEPHRIYNYSPLASQVVGLTDIDNNGLAGIELECDKLLAGEEGYVVMQKDGLGKKRPAIEYPRKEPVNGNNIVLTIDMNVQKIVEEELLHGVNINSADGGKCIVLAVRTGEILGMNSVLNSDNDDINYRNKLTFLTDLYEPGSTFKVVSAAASLEEGLQSKTDVIYTHGGEYEFYGLRIKDSHKFNSLSFQQVIEQSSNIGMIEVASQLGKERFYKYARDLGFGITTGIDLPGEVKGLLKKPVEFSPVSLKYMAIGYEVLVTALQMANAYACIANNGVLMRPYVIKRILAPDGSIIKENMPTRIRQVVSRSTARTLTELLYGAVERGTGTEAKIDNVKVAGKTGTAQKLVDGSYSRKKYTASFIGYFPAEDPQIVICVIIDAPGSGEFYGGHVAAPVFKQIASRIIAINGLIEYTDPLIIAEHNEDVKFAGQTAGINSPKDWNSLNLEGLRVEDAAAFLLENKIDFEIDGDSKNAVVTGHKCTGEEEGNFKIILYTKEQNEGEKPPYEVLDHKAELKMPDLTGLSLRKCIKRLSSLGVEYKINGTGRVITQKPEAGSVLRVNSVIVVNCGG